MAPISITHTTVKQDYSGSGAVAANQELIASDWNATHFTLSAGAGLQIASDGATPPTITFSIGGAAGTTSFGDSLIPSIDNTFDIGQLVPALLRWKNGFFAGTISVGTSSSFLPNAVLAVGSQTIPYAYTISSAGATYYARNGTTGAIDFSDTDAGVVIQNCNNAISAFGGTLFLKEARFVYALTLNMSGDVNILGSGPVASEITYTGSGTAIVMGARGRLEDLLIDTVTGNIALDLTEVSDSYYKQLRINGFRYDVRLAGDVTASALRNIFVDCKFNDNVLLTSVPSGNFQANINTFISCTVNGTTSVGDASNMPTGNAFLGCTFGSGLTTATSFVNYGIDTVLTSCDSERTGSIVTVDNEGSGRIVIIGGFYSNSNNTGIDGFGFINNGLSFDVLGVRGINRFSSLLPITDASIDVGSTSSRWQKGVFSSTVSAGSGFQTNDTTIGAMLPKLSTPIGFDLLLISGVGGQANPNFAPGTTGVQDLGRTDLKWRSIFYSSTLSGGSLIVSGITNNGTLTQVGNLTFGGSVSAGGGFQTNAATSLLAGGNIVPTSDNSSPTLGTSSFRWGGLWVTDIEAGGADLILNPNVAVRPLIASSNLKDLGAINALWRSGYFGTTVSAGGGFKTNATSTFSTSNPAVDNTYDLGTSSLRWRNSFFSGTTSTGTLQIGAGLVTAFNNRATAVNGVLAIVAEGDQTGTSAANASLASFTVGATNGVFKVGGDIDITVIAGATVTLQVVYTDWSGNVRTVTVVSSTALGDSPANDRTIMAQNGTAITLSTTLAGGTATWNVAAWIGWVK